MNSGLRNRGSDDQAGVCSFLVENVNIDNGFLHHNQLASWSVHPALEI